MGLETKVRTVTSPYDNDFRDVQVKLLIYFDEDTPLEINGDNYLVSLSLLEELSDTTSGLYGSLVANELSFSLYNANAIFNPANVAGPYYGKIETKVKVQVYIREAQIQEAYQCLGTYYVTDWKCNQGSSVADVVCHDLMYSVLEGTSKSIPLEYDVSLGDFLARLFTYLGLQSNQYVIEESLYSKIIPYAYIVSGKVIDTLEELMKTYMFYIYVDRDGVLQTKKIKYTGLVTAELDSDTQIISSSVGRSLLGSYSAVSVEASTLEVTEDLTLLSITEELTAGENTILDSNRDTITLDVDYVLCESNNDTVSVSGIAFDSNNIELTLNNNSNIAASTRITIIGKGMRTGLKTSYRKVNPTLANRIGESTLEVNGPFITTKEIANGMISHLYAYISNPSPIIQLSTRGNPEIMLGDIVHINDASASLDSVAMVLRQEFTYNGGFSCSIDCIDVATLGEVS